MSLRKRLLVKPPDTGGITPSEHFGIVLYEGDGSSPHSINGGKFGAAAYTANSGVVTLPDNVIDANNHSVSIWFYANNLSGEQHLMELDETNRIIFRISSPNNNDWCYIGNSGYFDHGLRFNTGQWYHIVITFSNGNPFKIYRNGSLEYTGGNTNLFANNSNNDVGAGSSTGTANVEGKIDQLRIFHKELSASEVSTLYAETAATVESLSPLGNETVDTLQVLGDTSCVALYKLENNEDDKSGNYNGTGIEVQYAAGRYGQGAIFLDSDSKINIPDNFGAEGETVSYSLWFKTTSADGSYMFAKRTGNNTFHIRIDNGYAFSPAGKICVNNWAGTNQAANNAVSTSGGYNDGSWHHFVFTYDGNQTTKTKCFIDGVYDSGMDWTYDLSTQSVSGGNNIGNYDLNSSNFSGTIDQVRVFNKTLSASEVTTLYQENSLVASYRFEGNANDDMRTYDGTASNVTYEYGLNFTPDFVWIKDRGQSREHILSDSTRGSLKEISPSASDAEENRGVYSFDTGGFSFNDGNSNYNSDGQDYVAWCLKANGGTTSSNTDGSTTSTVQANQDAGFSIIKYTGTGANASVGHSLSTAPDAIFIKRTSSSADWIVGALDWTKYLELNGNPAFRTANVWQNTAPTNSVFTITTSGGTNASGEDYIAYCFHSVDGFSKIGSYLGTGAAGNLIETGFEPAFIMFKRTDSTGGWLIFDNKRNLTNPRNTRIEANNSQAEQAGSTSKFVDFYSNGFEPQVSDSEINASGASYFFMAFAADPDTEQPTVAKSFNTVTWTGTGSSQTINGLGFAPNLVWLKQRGGTTWHNIQDTIMGATKHLYTNATNALDTTSNGLTSYDSDGFTLGGGNGFNGSSQSMVGWAWKTDNNEPTIFMEAGVVAGYKFDETNLAETADDLSGNFDLANDNVSYTTTAKFTRAADFNGTNAKLKNDSFYPLIGSNAYSVSFWFYGDTLSSSSGDQWLWGLGNSTNFSDTSIYLRNNNIIFHDNYGNSDYIANNTVSLSASTWYHFVFVYDGAGTGTGYLNGTKLSDFSRTLNRTGTTLRVGCRQNDADFFDGKIDQMRFYTQALDQTQVNSLYNETISDNSTLEFPTGITSAKPLSLVSANANAGFSIVKYEGTGIAGTKVPHGLSAAPDMVIIKNLTNGSTNWWTWHKDLGGGDKYVALDSTSGVQTATTIWNGTAPTSTVFSVGTDSGANGNGTEIIAYCWHSVSGYSKIGSYTGTGTTNSITGLGFQPDWLMIKRTTGGSSNGWVICDSVRGVGINLRADTSSAEADESAYTTSFDSDGFTLAQAGGNTNVSGSTYIYMAFKIN
jgi:hypothetical protein